jgi:hypothetical protein
MDAAGASVVLGHVTGDNPGMGSVTFTSVMVTFPVLVTV